MPAVVRNHRLLILAFAVALAALLLAVVVFDVNHAQVAIEHARAAAHHVSDWARSSWGRHVSHLRRA
jgi:hypothetical protein